jgi:hypothetical protein
LKINRSIIYQVLFFIAIFVPTFNFFELTILVWSFLFLITIKQTYSKTIFKISIPFLLIIITATVVSFFHNYELYFKIRDFVYLSKPVLGLFIGYNLFKNNNKNPYETIIICGVWLASFHLFLVLFALFFKGAFTVREIRDHAGFFNDFEVYVLIILIFYKKFELQLTKSKIKLYIVILSISSFFYLARTNFIQFLILFLVLKGWFKLNFKTLKVIFSILLVSGISYFAIYQYNPKRNGDGMDEFLYKIKLIPLEAFETKINRGDWKDFHDHYRSYENIRTIEQLSHNGSFIFGEGIGSQVDLKQKVFLGDMEMRHISILHNGYITILLKTGIFGLIFLLYSIFQFSFFKVYNTTLEKYTNEIFFATAVFLIISNWVFLGLYNLLDTKVILLGFLIAYKNQQATQQ